MWPARRISMSVPSVLAALPAAACCWLVAGCRGGAGARAQNPSRTQRLRCSPPHRSSPWSRLATWHAGRAAARLPFGARAGLAPDAGGFHLAAVRGSQDADAVAHALPAALLAHGAPRHEALLAGMHWLETVDLRALVSRVRQPALLVTGRNDRVTVPAAAQWLPRRCRRRAAIRRAPAMRRSLAPHRGGGRGLREFLALHAAEPAP